MSKRSASYGNAHAKRPRLPSGTTFITGYNRATGGLTAAARSKSLQRAVASAVKKTVEKKGVDFPLTIVGPVLSTTNTNGDCFVLNLVQAGAGSWNRVGRKIQLQSIRIRCDVNYSYKGAVTSNSQLGNMLRMVVVWDKQPSGAAIPTFDTVFGVTGQDGSETTTFLNPVRYDNMDRFSVLRDCVMDMNPDIYNSGAGSTNLGSKRIAVDEFIKLNGRETVFLGQSAPMTIADVSSGALYVYFRAASSVDDINDIALTPNSFARLRYIDP